MSAADRRSLADAVGEEWDAFVRGLPASPSPALDPSFAATIRRVAALDDARAADPVFVRRLERELMGKADAAASFRPFALAAPPAALPNGHVRPRWSFPAAPAREPRQRQWPAMLAMAALLLATFAGGYLALLRPPRFDDRDRPPDIPALVGSADASPAAANFTSESLLEITIPAGTFAQPTTGTNIWLFSHYAVKPGGHVAYPDDCAAPDFVVRYVLDGVYDVRPTGPLEVIRDASAGANARSETVAAGQAATLRAGDALVYRNTTNDRYAGFVNPGPGQLDLLEWQWLDRDCLSAIPPGLDLQWDAWTRWDARTTANLLFDPTRAFTLRFRRMTAAPGATLPQNGPTGPGFLPPGMPGLEVGAAEAGRVKVENNVANASVLSPNTTYWPRGGLVAGSSQLPPGAPRTIESAGDQPLLLYVLTIMNVDAAGRPALPASPAAGVAAGLPPGVADALLLQATIDKPLPSAPWVGIQRVSLAPGAQERFGDAASHREGAIAFRVESGAVTFMPDGPALVTRDASEPNAKPTSVAAGGAVVLSAGDEAFTEAGVASVRRNDGPTPAAMVALSLTTDRAIGANHDGVAYADPVREMYPVNPPPPVVVTLRRLTLAPGANMPARELPGLDVVNLESGALDVAWGASMPAALDASTHAPRTTHLIAPQSLTEMGKYASTAELRNAGDEPVVFLAVTVASAGTVGTPAR